MSNKNILRDRFSEVEIYERVVAEAAHEMSKSYRQLLFSGIAGGFAITLTFLMYASMTDATDGAAFLSAILYTENTLPPVALVLERLSTIPAMLTMWGIVLLGNVIGGTIGALLLAYTGIFPESVAQTGIDIATSGVEEEWWDLFFKGAMAGLIVAGVVWMDFSVHSDMARFSLIYLAFLAIPLGNLYHVVVATTEVMYLVFLGEIGLIFGIYNFAIPVMLGNTVGGVLLVTVVNYYQTPQKIHQISDKLSIKQVFFSYKRTQMTEDEVIDSIEENREH